jgi:hypothetical protein
MVETLKVKLGYDEELKWATITFVKEYDHIYYLDINEFLDFAKAVRKLEKYVKSRKGGW